MDALGNPYLIVPITTLLVSQIIKYGVAAFKKDYRKSNLLAFDGVINTAFAIMLSLVTVSLTVDGATSRTFGLSVTLTIIVILTIHYGLKQYEAMRQQVRELANHTKAVSPSLDPINNTWLSDVLGAVLGVSLAGLLTMKYWQDTLDVWFDTPSTTEATIYLAIFGVAFVIGEGLSLLVSRGKLRKLPTSRKLRRAFRISLSVPAAVGAVFAFMQRETIEFMDSRFFTAAAVAWIVGASVWAYFYVYRTARTHLNEEAEHFTKEEKKAKKAKRKSTKKPTKKNKKNKKK